MHRKAPVLKSFLTKLLVFRPLGQKETLTQVFSCKYFEIFKSTSFYRTSANACFFTVMNSRQKAGEHRLQQKMIQTSHTLTIQQICNRCRVHNPLNGMIRKASFSKWVTNHFLRGTSQRYFFALFFGFSISMLNANIASVVDRKITVTI